MDQTEVEVLEIGCRQIGDIDHHDPDRIMRVRIECGCRGYADRVGPDPAPDDRRGAPATGDSEHIVAVQTGKVGFNAAIGRNRIVTEASDDNLDLVGCRVESHWAVVHIDRDIPVVATVHDQVVGIEEERIVSVAPVKRIGTVVSLDFIVTRLTENQVVAVISFQIVIVGATIDRVASISSMYLVVAGVTEQQVGTFLAHYKVIVGTTIDGIVTAAATKRVLAGHSVDGVIAESSIDDIGVVVAV